MRRKAPQTLRKFYEAFAKLVFNGKSKDALRTYRCAIGRLEAFLGRAALLDDLKLETIDGLRKALAGKYAHTTIVCTERRLRTLWRAAHQAKFVSSPPPEPVYGESGLRKIAAQRAERRPQSQALLEMGLRFDQPPVTLFDLLDRYILERGLKPMSASQLRCNLNSLSRHIGRVPVFADLSDVIVNSWLASMLASGLDPETVKTRRTGLLTLWRAAYESHLIGELPTRVRRVRVQTKKKKCWSPGQQKALLAAASSLGGWMQRDERVRRADFWTAWVLVAYYSGLRLGDLCKLQWEDVDRDGVISIVQAKTGNEIICRLPEDARKVLSRIHVASDRKLVFGLTNRLNAMRFFRRMLRNAGLPGSMKWLRRTGATMVEFDSAGSAKAFLGHRTAGLADRNYLDHAQLQREKPSPPSFGESRIGGTA